MTMTLLGSLVALLLGPVIYHAVERNRSLLDVIDGFVFISVGGLVLMHLIPSLAEAHALGILLAAFLGFLGPNIFERVFHKAERKIHLTALFLAVLGLILHAAVDGAAIAMGGVTQEQALLPIAIIIHRLPVGLALWWLTRPRFSTVFCWGAIGALCAATVGGFVVGEELFLAFGHTFLQLVQAFVAGSILHVVFFRVHFEAHLDHKPCCCHSPSEKTVGGDGEILSIGSSKLHSPARSSLVHSWPESIGNILGILLLLVLLGLHSESAHVVTEAHHHHDHLQTEGGFLSLFLSIAQQSAPALFIAHFAAILLYGFLPVGSMKWLSKGTPLLQSFKGVSLGLPLPVCSCGILPFYKTLVEKGAPPAAALAFLIATPELGIDAVLLSVPLLGTHLAIVRVFAAFFLALLVSIFLYKLAPQTRSDIPEAQEPEQTFLGRLKLGTSHSLVKLIDSTAPWIIFGMALAAFASPLLQNLPTTLPYHLEIVLFALIGVVVYVCASGATPLAAVFIASGVSPGAAIAFLLTGPATNVSTFGVLSELHGRTFGYVFGIVTSLLAIGFGYLIHFLAPLLTIPQLNNMTEHQQSSYMLIALLVVFTLYFASFVRKGGRGFFKEIFGRGIA